MKIFLSALITSYLCFATLAVSAKTHQVYVGNIGKAGIAMDLEIQTTGDVEGRYFYRKYRTDITLEGRREKDGTLHLNEKSQSEKNRAKLILRMNGSNLQGEWQDVQKNKKLPVSLSPANEQSAISNNEAAQSGFHSNSLYDSLRLVGLSLRPLKREKFQGYSIQWWEEPNSEVRMFRLLDGFPIETVLRINRRLGQEQWRSVSAYYDCQSGGARALGADFMQTVTPKLINPQFISVSIFTSYYCGGAHPDFGDRPLNIDVASSEDLQLEDILWLGNGKPSPQRNAARARTDQRYEEMVLGPWLAKTMAKLYPAEVTPPEGGSKDNGECDYRDSEVWQYISWYATPQGLYIGPSFPRASRACEYPEWSVLPWRIVRAHPGAKKYSLPK